MRGTVFPRSPFAGPARFFRGAMLPLAIAGMAPVPAAAAGPETAPAGQEQGSCSAEQEAANKQLIVDALARGPNAVFDLIDPDYIQHNPEYFVFGELNGVDGRRAVEMLEQYRFGEQREFTPPPRAPGQPADNFLYRLVADCDIVVMVGQHWQPYPNDPAKFYPFYFFNMWRFRDGRLIEHWDPDKLPEPLPPHLLAPLDQLPGDGAHVAGPESRER